jgi:hypothetical protein
MQQRGMGRSDRCEVVSLQAMAGAWREKKTHRQRSKAMRAYAGHTNMIKLLQRERLKKVLH